MAQPLPPHPDHRSTNQQWDDYHEALQRDRALWATLPVDYLELEPDRQRYRDHRRCPTCRCLMSRPVAFHYLDLSPEEREPIQIPPGYTLKQILAAAIHQTFALTGSNVYRTAKLLGINRRTLTKWLTEQNMPMPRRHRRTPGTPGAPST